MLVITADMMSLRVNNPNRREPIASLRIPRNLVPRLSSRPSFFKIQARKFLTGQNLTGISSLTVALDTAFARPGRTEWLNNDHSAVAFIYADGGSPGPANKVNITTFNYWPTNSVVLSVPGAQQTTGRTVEVLYLLGEGLIELLKLERQPNGLTREVRLFGPSDLNIYHAADPLHRKSMLTFSGQQINPFETLQLVYTSVSSNGVVNWGAPVSTVPYAIHIDTDLTLLNI